MFIIKIQAEENNFHPFESQSHRTKNWKAGYAVVPEELVPGVLSACGFCNLVVENGMVVSFTVTEKPEEPEAEPTTEEILNAMLGVE